MADKFKARNLKGRREADITEREVRQIVSFATGANVQEFTADGTWTKSLDARMVFVEMWAGGGSGAAAADNGGGGGGGQYVSRWFHADDLGATEAVTVGQGGASVTGDSNGNAGTDSSLGAHLTAHGGKGGKTASTGLTADGGAGGSAEFSNEARVSTVLVERHGWGSGAGGPATDTDGFAGGNAVMGGAGGGGIPDDGAPVGSGGTSSVGGAGGAANAGGNGVDGTAPGGGGGACAQANNSGAGADGRVLVISFKLGRGE